MEVQARRQPLAGQEREEDRRTAVSARQTGRSIDRYIVAKRAVDIAVAGLALLFLAPLFLVIALLVKLDNRGPALYRRRVVAQNGHSPHPIDPSTVHTFDALKFRTMVPDADEVLANDPELLAEYLKDFKLDDDPRITRVGRFLRKTNLDELPQFINVLLGQMSVVGPRIITPPELEKYGRLSGKLLSVRPGMSGLWQVMRGCDHSYDRRVAIDMMYIQRHSTRMDLSIILKTTLLMLGKGSG